MKYLVIGIIVCFSISLKAQDCKDFLCLQAGKTIELSMFKDNGKPNGKLIYRISNVTAEGNGYSGQVHSEMLDKRGQFVSSSSNLVGCKDGVYAVDMVSFMPVEQQNNVSASTKRAYVTYPNNMATGQTLVDGTFDVTVESSQDHPIETNVTIEVKNRQVIGKETVTSPAGTWDCFVITSKQKYKINIRGIGLPMKSELTEWFAPGVGVVKTKTNKGSTLITSIK